MTEKEQHLSGAESGDRAGGKRPESGYASLIGRRTTDGRVLVGQDIEIFTRQECSDFASPGTRAYDAKDRRLTGAQMALICGPGMIPRISTLSSYKNLKNPHILKLIEAGIIDWPI